MARGMKILQIKRIIGNLLNGGRCETIGTDLKLDHKNDAPEQHDSVGALSHSRDRKFKSKPTFWNALQALAKQLNLLQPSRFLC